MNCVSIKFLLIYFTLWLISTIPSSDTLLLLFANCLTFSGPETLLWKCSSIFAHWLDAGFVWFLLFAALLCYISYIWCGTYIATKYIYPSSLKHLHHSNLGSILQTDMVEVYLLSSFLDVTSSKPCRICLLSTLISVHLISDLSNPPQVYKFWSVARLLGPHQCSWLSGHRSKIRCLLINSLVGLYVLWG